jgi:PRTRC genetic system protein E
VSACPGAFRILDSRFHCTWHIKEDNVFVELMPLLKVRTLLLTIARVEDKVKVNVIPAKAKEGEDQALTTPLSYTASPEELDSELGKHLASYVDAHLSLGSTLAEAKAEMDAAAKAVRQKAKATQLPKAEATAPKKAEPATPTSGAIDPTPSLFPAQSQSTEPPASSPEDERKTS